ncbi:hypothetical protein ACFXPX_02570 [Kitasatospora sp. NPDC059146]|uniref:hypothetical protein n=1 Tax=Kitasatospora sp. NPDC059146 TaxID=3346741 RepID=UPI0036C87B2F
MTTATSLPYAAPARAPDSISPVIAATTSACSSSGTPNPVVSTKAGSWRAYSAIRSALPTAAKRSISWWATSATWRCNRCGSSRARPSVITAR